MLSVQFDRTAVSKQTVLENDNDNVIAVKQAVPGNGIGSVSALPKQAVLGNDIGNVTAVPKQAVLGNDIGSVSALPKQAVLGNDIECTS